MSDFNENDHPRNPAGSPNGKGGRFSTKDTAGDDFDLVNAYDSEVLAARYEPPSDRLRDDVAELMDEQIMAHAPGSVRVAVNRNDNSLILVSDSDRAVLVRPVSTSDGLVRVDCSSLGRFDPAHAELLRCGECDESWEPVEADPFDGRTDWSSPCVRLDEDAEHDDFDVTPISPADLDGDDDDPLRLRWAVNRCMPPTSDYAQAERVLDEQCFDGRGIRFTRDAGWHVPGWADPETVESYEDRDHWRDEYVDAVADETMDRLGVDESGAAGDLFNERYQERVDVIKYGVIGQLNGDGDYDPADQRRLAEWASNRNDLELRAEGEAWLERHA